MNMKSDERLLDVGQVLLDPDVQARVCIDEDTIDEYADAWKREVGFPPVDVFFDGKIYRLADGAHRLLAARRAGLKEIRAVVHEGTARDAFLFAAKCNAAHGRRRTNGDKRFLVIKFLQDPEWGQKSGRWIAEASLTSHTFVQNVRSELATVASSELLEGRDGKLRPATQSRTASERAPRSLATLSVEERREFCTLWWDQLAKYTVLLSTAGWEPQKIADFLGMSLEEDVLPILNPRPASRDVADFRGISEKPERLAEVYGEVVNHIVSFLLERCYAMAALVAEDEGFLELKGAIAERQRYHGDKAKQLRSVVCSFAGAATHWREFVCTQMCASLDVRFGLGIEENPDLTRRAEQPLIESVGAFMREVFPDQGSDSGAEDHMEAPASGNVFVNGEDHEQAAR
jgi:hypothetical protein